MLDDITNFFKNLKLADEPVTPNFKPDVVDKLMKPALLPIELYKNSRPWKGIVIHHSSTVDGRANDWEAIRKYHMSYRVDGTSVGKEEFELKQAMRIGTTFEKPWRDIAYHLGLEYEFDELKVRIGRPLSDMGAHAGISGNNTFNETHIGICIVGDFDKAAPTLQVLEMLSSIAKELMGRYSFGKEAVLGHREIYPILKVPVQKTCPGKMFSMDGLRLGL